MNRLNKLTIPDVALIILLVFGSVWFLLGSADAQSGKKSLFVYRDSVVIKELDMTASQIIKLSLNHGEMDIELNPAKGVHILHSDCPAKVCVHTGWIKNPGETIICLPNKVLLEIKGEGTEEYDAIAY